MISISWSPSNHLFLEPKTLTKHPTKPPDDRISPRCSAPSRNQPGTGWFNPKHGGRGSHINPLKLKQPPKMGPRKIFERYIFEKTNHSWDLSKKIPGVFVFAMQIGRFLANRMHGTTAPFTLHWVGSFWMAGITHKCIQSTSPVDPVVSGANTKWEWKALSTIPLFSHKKWCTRVDTNIDGPIFWREKTL